jgi:peptide/nickel transport system substrate-binding protein
MISRSHLLAASLLCATLAGCPGGSGEGGIERVDAESLIKVITADAPSTLDPHATSNGADAKVIVQVYERLVRVSPQDLGVIEPWLAESWTVSADKKVLTFNIRDGVTFHDGEVLDAAACKLSLDRARGVELLGPAGSPYSGEFALVDSIQAEGSTLTIRLKEPAVRVALRNLTMFCASIVSPKVLAATDGMSLDEAKNYVTRNAAGTGAYKVDNFDPSAHVTRLVAHAGYWGGTPTVQTLIFQQVIDEDTRYQRITGEAGYVVLDDVPRQRWTELEGSGAVTLRSWWAINLCYMAVNGQHEATREPEVRRAIQLAVDRSRVVEHYEGTARPTYSLVAQPLPEYDPALRTPGWTDDLTRRQELARAELERVGAVGRKVTVYFPQDPRPYLPRPQDVADTIRQQLTAIGLEPTILGVRNSELFDGIPSGRYELVVMGWTTDNGDPDNFYSPLADGADGEPGSSNGSRVFDQRVHDMLVRGAGMEDATQRRALYREVELYLQTEVRGFVPLVNTKQAIAHTATIENIELDGMGEYHFHQAVLGQPSQ